MFGTEVARKKHNDEELEAILYKTIGGYAVLVQRTDCDYVLGAKFFASRADATAYVELLTTWPPFDDLLRAAEYFGERACLLAVGPLLWLPRNASRPHLAYEEARKAASLAFEACPRLRAEPKRPEPPRVHPHTECVCGHWLCYHVAVRLPCLYDDCDCRAFKEQPAIPPQPPGQSIPPRPCPNCRSPNFEQVSFDEVGTFGIFVIRCARCKRLRTLADDEDAYKWKN